MTKDILLTATYLVGVGELLLAGYFWKTNSGSEIRKVMVATCSLLGVWVFSSALISYREDAWWVGSIVQLIQIAGLLLLVTLLYLVIIYPYKSIIFDNLHRVLLYLPSIFFIYCFIFTDTIVEGYQVSKDSTGIIFGGLPGMIVDVVIPTIIRNPDINTLYGVIASGIWVGATSFIALKKV